MSFTKGTKLNAFEIMMTRIPNFRPRGGGTYIKDRKPTALKYKDFDYTSFMKKKQKSLKTALLNTRFDELIQDYNGNMFLNDDHKNRYYKVCRELKTTIYSVKSDILGAVYLLTTSEKLWNLTRSCVGSFSIDFTKIKLKNINSDEYTVYQMAKTLYDRTPRIRLSEMADKEIVSSNAFKAIIHSVLVKAYGGEILEGLPGNIA